MFRCILGAILIATLLNSTRQRATSDVLGAFPPKSAYDCAYEPYVNTVVCITCRHRYKRVLRGKAGQRAAVGWRQQASQAGACAGADDVLVFTARY